jgi:sugar phosphate isomerase/epimerase/SAM-dependent methyltransferase
MRIARHPASHLTYCLNVHPGETWAENFSAIKTHALAVRAIVAPGVPFGFGLRLSRQAAETLMDANIRADFKGFLSANDLYAFTINGFPYGAFHGTRVKEAVYQPDWRTRERVDYTLMLAEILADLLPEGVPGSISTVPGAYRAAVTDDRDRATIAAALGQMAGALERLSQERGREISVGLEPEPDCLIETTDEMIAFMQQDMTAAALPVVCRELGLAKPRAEAVIRRRIGLCLDTCHSAMQFETPADALRKAIDAGVHVCKIQVSAALTATSPAVTTAQLEAFDDNVYLHQVRIRDAQGRVSRFPDLPQALTQQARDAGNAPREWRIHCHVPLDYTGDGALGTTAGDLTPAFFAQAMQSGIAHLEIETYTFGVLPASLRAVGITNSIANEFAWVRGKFSRRHSGKVKTMSEVKQVTPGRIMDMASAFFESAALFAASDLGVFKQLAGGDGTSLEPLADVLKLDPHGLRLLLDACVAIGLLAKSDNGQYRNAPDTEAFLVPGKRGDLSQAIRYNRDVYDAWGKLAELARTGKPVERPELHLGDDPNRTRDFVLAMHGRALAMAPLLIPSLDLAGRARMLDAGGGPGTFAVLAAQANPGLHCTVLDLPDVAAIAGELIAQQGMTDRVDTLPGDYHTTPFPQGMDAINFLGVLHQESPASIQDLFKRAYAALKPGGVVHVLDMMTDASHTQPRFSAMFAVNMALTTDNGWVFSDHEVEQWLREAGFARISTTPLPPPAPHWLTRAYRPE